MSNIIEQAEAVLKMGEKLYQSDLYIIYGNQYETTQPFPFESVKEYLDFIDIYSKITAIGLKIPKPMRNMNQGDSRDE